VASAAAKAADPEEAAPREDGELDCPRSQCGFRCAGLPDRFARVRRADTRRLTADELIRIPRTDIDMRHLELHRTDRIGWLRAAVLGANDGIVSTASLIVGVASANTGRDAILLAGIAGLVAGAFSMAAGEYVSVSSQADTEQADLARERGELAVNPAAEEEELAHIYVGRGLEPPLARTVAQQLMAHDALGAHARDELGISEMVTARPVQAALASAATFAVGAALPVLTILVVPVQSLALIVSVASLLCLAGLGAVAAHVGGASPWRGAARVTFWGVLAMIGTAAIGHLFGTTVS